VSRPKNTEEGFDEAKRISAKTTVEGNCLWKFVVKILYDSFYNIQRGCIGVLFFL
jgi:hypothetical protein